MAEEKTHVGRVGSRPEELTTSFDVGPGAAPAASLAGRTVDDFEVLQEVGHGAMGVVYKARQKSLDRLVALKVLSAEAIRNPTVLARFLVEARTAAQLRHPNIITIHQVGHCAAGHYFVMEFIEGPTLGTLLRTRGLPVPWVVHLMIHVSDAVHYAHTRGIIHRDLKPGNVMIEGGKRPVVLDFGLAKVLEGPAAGLTQDGFVLGTPSYMAPEQARGGAAHATPLSDVYSLGAILYHALARRKPFQADTLVDTIAQVLSAEMPPPVRALRPKVPPGLEQVCMKCLAKRPEDRYPSAAVLAHELRLQRATLSAGPPTPAPPADFAGERTQAGSPRAAEGFDPEYDLAHLLPDLTDLAPEAAAALENLTPAANPVPGAAGPGSNFASDVLLEIERSSSRPRLGDLVGTTLNRYEIRSLLGKGPFGFVFRATDTKYDRSVALRVLFPETFPDDARRDAFVRSLNPVKALVHPNLANLLKAGRTDSYCWVSVEYVKGTSLKALLKQLHQTGRLDWRHALRLGRDVARALEPAHGRRLAHGHITPGNVLVKAKDRTAKLSDFMLLAALRECGAEPQARDAVADLAYVAPEQTYPGARPTARADLYSLGAVLYRALAGRACFEAATEEELIDRVRRMRPMPLQDDHGPVPRAVEEMVKKLLAKDPAERYQTAAELLATLEKLLPG